MCAIHLVWEATGKRNQNQALASYSHLCLCVFWSISYPIRLLLFPAFISLCSPRRTLWRACLCKGLYKYIFLTSVDLRAEEFRGSFKSASDLTLDAASVLEQRQSREVQAQRKNNSHSDGSSRSRRVREIRLSEFMKPICSIRVFISSQLHH